MPLMEIELLEQNGFTIMSVEENRISLDKGYTENGFADKVYHIHLRYSGDNMSIIGMLIQIQKQISSPNGRQKHERNMEIDTDKSGLYAIYPAFYCLD